MNLNKYQTNILQKKEQIIEQLEEELSNANKQCMQLETERSQWVVNLNTQYLMYDAAVDYETNIKFCLQ